MATPYPPSHHHRITRLPPSAARALISTYLTATTTDPSLHPNAILTENGPVTPSSGTNTGLVLYNLARLEAGLGGEYLSADLPKKFTGGDLELVDTALGADATAGAQEQSGPDVDAMWQDREEWEREQDPLEGMRDETVEEGVLKRVKSEGVLKRVKSEGEKETRRREKKERMNREKKEREAQRRRERDAEG